MGTAGPHSLSDTLSNSRSTTGKGDADLAFAPLWGKASPASQPKGGLVSPLVDFWSRGLTLKAVHSHISYFFITEMFL